MSQGMMVRFVMRLFIFLGFVLVVGGLTPKTNFLVANASEQDLKALVLVNTSYPISKLDTADNEFENLKSSLIDKGFDVTFAKNVGYIEMRSHIKQYTDSLGEADLSIIYYAGHAATLSEKHYLIPSDNGLRSRTDLRKLVPLPDVILAGAESSRSLIVLDTCRISDMARGWGHRFEKKSLCLDEKPTFSLPENTSLLFTNTETLGVSDSLDSEFVTLLGEELLDAEELIQTLDATLVGVRTSWPMLLGSRDRFSFLVDEKNLSDKYDVNFEGGKHTIGNLGESLYLSKSINDSVVLTLSDEGLQEEKIWILQNVSSDQVEIIDHISKKVLDLSNDGWLSLQPIRPVAAHYWQLEKAKNSLDDEWQLRHIETGGYLRRNSRDGLAVVSEIPSKAGWLIRRVQDKVEYRDSIQSVVDARKAAEQIYGSLSVIVEPADSKIRILNIAPKYEIGINLPVNENYQIEVSKPGFNQVVRWVRLDEMEKTVKISLVKKDVKPNIEPKAISVPVKQITPAERNLKLSSFRQIADALKQSDQASIQRLLPISERRSVLLELMAIYPEIHADIYFVRSRGQKVLGTLKLNRLIQTNGDIVTPSDSYSVYPLESEKLGENNWSEIRWQE